MNRLKQALSLFRKQAPHPVAARWMAQTGWDGIATTVVTVTELQRGIERARAQHPTVALDAEGWLDGLLAVGAPQVLPLGFAAARLLGRMYEVPELRHSVVTGRQARSQATGADLAIAAPATAIAIGAGAMVATANVGHFLQISAAFPLPGLFDPLTQTWHVHPAA